LRITILSKGLQFRRTLAVADIAQNGQYQRERLALCQGFFQ